MTHRTPWSALPNRVVQAIEAELGAPIVDRREATEGFSPAVAASVQLANGCRAFVKACSAGINAKTIDFQRHEAMVVRQLPASVPTPTLLFEAELGDWHVLGFDHVDARPVVDPLAHMLGIDALYDALEGVRVDGLVHFLEFDEGFHTSWAELASTTPGFDELVELESGMAAMRDSAWLIHCDARDDNALVARDGRVFFVDWANACEGSPLIDAVGAIPALVVRFGATVPELVAQSRLITNADPEIVTATVAALAGYFAYASTRPAPTNMPTLRAFQRAQAVPMLAWLQDRVGDALQVPTMDEIDRAVAPGRRLGF
jgi:hypothetical protein